LRTDNFFYPAVTLKCRYYPVITWQKEFSGMQ